MTRRTLRGQVAIISGASSGIGRATALALAAEGARLALAARSADRLRATADEIKAQGGEALALPTDVTHREQVERLVRETLDHWGRLDVVVANAGQYIRCPVRELTVAAVERSLAVNFYGGLHLALAALPTLLAQGSGHLIFVTSMDGKKGLPPDAPYVAAKFALTGLAEVMRQELRGSGVAVTTVLPGRVDTPMIETLRVPWISAKVPPEAVAGAIVRAVYRSRPEVIVPRWAKVLVYVNTVSPRLGDWAVRAFHLAGWDEKSRGRFP